MMTVNYQKNREVNKVSDNSLVQRVTLQSSQGAPEEVFSAWRESISPYFDSHPLYDVDEKPPVALNATQYHLGRFLFYDTTFPRQKLVRDRRWSTQHDDTDHILLQSWLKGVNVGRHDDQEFRASAGNIFAGNLAYDVVGVCEDAEMLTLALPRHWLIQHLPQLETLHGQVFAEDWSMGVRIFDDYMLSLRKNLPTMKQSELPMLHDNVLAMLESLLSYGDIESQGVKDNSVSVMCNYIEKNLQNPNLGIGNLCQHFRCSRATVYRLFKPHGGVRAFIQRRRLMAVFKMLASPVHSRKRIFEIAQGFGFTNQSHFSSLFKHHFNMSPKEVREVGVGRRIDPLKGQADVVDVDVSNSTLSGAELMRAWAQTLNHEAKT